MQLPEPPLVLRLSDRFSSAFDSTFYIVIDMHVQMY